MKTYLVAATLAALTAPAAQALVIDETEHRSTGSYYPTDLDTTFSFDGYQGSGTVSEVTVTYGGDVISVYDQAVNTGADAATFSATTTSHFFFSSDDVTVPGAPLGISVGTGLVTLGAGEARMFRDNDWDSFSDTVTGPDIGGFLAPFEISVETLTGFTQLGGANSVTVDKASVALGGVRVEYKVDDDVSVAPLPAAAWMLLAGLASLLAFRRFNTA